ncbi:histidine phosphatase family protein [Amycolatopsis sp. CA-230715]|uniref:histidine phosphatase family protein n=1 Tax=Amycolatopsis sp. CA-230715 TaxID=2745196 RepID=UPI001C0151DF|nr:histidine phosphatase family protein [Amycolatopsis sp. CA-230715]QWF80250.1 PE-PGRS family protein PE_PGRS11 [Amycolatopsis sp. CA-230715]
MRLHLVRHAQSTANVRKVLDTALPGPSLTDLGRQQAEALVAAFDGLEVAAVYSSYATRARETAAPLAASLGFDVRLVEGVHEVQAGDLEGRNDEEAIATYLAVVHPWTQGDLSGSMPGGESGAQVRSRYLAAVAELRAKHEEADPAGDIVLVSHGGAIRLGAEWLCDNVRPEVADNELLANTARVVLEARAGGWHCESWAGAPM